MTDVRLENDRVVAEGHSFRVSGEDLELRSSTRLGARNRRDLDADKPRRALVHGTEDQLIVNFDRDYHHVELHGAVEIHHRRTAATLLLRNSSGHAETIIAGGLVHTDRDVRIGALRALSGSRSLIKTLEWLSKRVAELEGNPNPPKLPEERG